MAEEIVRIKVLHEKGSINIYYYTKLFWFMGYWTILGTLSGGSPKLVKQHLTNENACKMFYSVIKKIQGR